MPGYREDNARKARQSRSLVFVCRDDLGHGTAIVMGTGTSMSAALGLDSSHGRSFVGPEDILLRLVAFTPAVVVCIDGVLRGCAQCHVRQSVKLALACLRHEREPDLDKALRLANSAFAAFSAAHASNRSHGVA